MTAETFRKGVPLTSDEVTAVADARRLGTPLNGALLEFGGMAALKSEASALHAILVLGLAELKARALTAGYEQLAAAQDDEDRAYAAAMRRRGRGGAAE